MSFFRPKTILASCLMTVKHLELIGRMTNVERPDSRIGS